MSEKIKLKVGDTVRLIGEQWSQDRDYPVHTGNVVTVDYIAPNGAPFNDRTENLTTVDGFQFGGYEIEKVSDAPVTEPRDVTLPGVVEYIKTLIEGMVELGYPRDYARENVLGYIEERLKND